jgi:hypothetical protein
MTESDVSPVAHIRQFLSEIISSVYLNYWLHRQETTDHTITTVGEERSFLFEFMANTAG